MAGKKSTNNTKKAVQEEDVQQYLIDTEVPLPEEFAHLVVDGSIKLFFGAETREMIEDISAELMMSRDLPVDVGDVGIGDSMVLWLIAKRSDEFDEDGKDAIMAARHIYESQIQDCNREALILAITAYTEITDQFDEDGQLVEPESVLDGAKPLTEKSSNREKSSFVRLMERRKSDLPEVKRNMRNPYEARMQWLDATINKAGFRFYNSTVTAINREISKIVKDLPEKDSAGFHPESASNKMAARDNADDTGTSKS